MAMKITTLKKISAEPTEKKEKEEQKNLIFALDIGTRSVIGLLGYPSGEKFVVLDWEVQYHTHRCMIDGQIQDIYQVAKIVEEVKRNLEKRNGVTLQEVSIAAAGRALITQNSRCERTVDSAKPITADLISSMEMEAVQMALDNVSQQDERKSDFYCVGHSVVTQTLDKYPLINLIGHKGENIMIEILAAFLPSTVVESLYSTMAEVGLRVKNITLEPIAAMNALIPDELRMLNLALVDIGAGTSDIAISRDGAVVSYAMATIAGDEITEALIKTFLVDFKTAEGIKLSLKEKPERIVFTDILGFTYDKSCGEILSVLTLPMEDLVGTICDRILEVNKSAPTAIFLAGGGSLIPNLAAQVASQLSMDENRVAIGSNSFLKNVEGSVETLNNPQFVTPIGIALTAMKQDGFDFYTVTLNGERVKIFNEEGLTVGDILSMNGIKSSQLIGLSGNSLTYEIDGKRSTLRGGISINGEVKINDMPASIRTAVKAGDKIELKYAEHGENAQLFLRDLVDLTSKGVVEIGNSKVSLDYSCTVNGEEVDGSYEVKNYDVIKTSRIQTLGDAAKHVHISLEENDFFCLDEMIEEDFELEDGFVITCVRREIRTPVELEKQQEQDKAEEPVESVEIPEKEETRETSEKKETDEKDEEQASDSPIEEKPVAEEKPEKKEEVSAPTAPRSARTVTVTINGCEQAIPYHKDGTPPIFADAAAIADLDLKQVRGRIYVKLNGEDTSYTVALKTGDVVDIYWE